MASSRRTNHSRQRRQRHASISSDDSSASVWSDQDGNNTQRRPLTTPRTKRRSITQLNELVRRQKQAQQDQRRHVTVTPQDIERKMESLLAPRASPGKPRERRLIQVAVRCRPRKCTRFRRRRAFGNSSEDEEDEDGGDDDDEDGEGEINGGGDTSVGGRWRLPVDSIVEYDLPKEVDNASPRGSSSAPRHRSLPAISVPSHVLALGGHGPRRRFEFDCVLPPWKQQRDVYDATAYEVIEDVLATTTQGRTDDDTAVGAAHATIVAYGQTGTGKTYTMGMLQHADDATDEREHGLIPRALIHILSRVHDANAVSGGATRQDGPRLVVCMSFLQIYLETIQDLLTVPGRATTIAQVNGERRGSIGGNTQATQSGLQVRLDPTTNEFYVVGLSELPIRDVTEARSLLERAAQNRVLAATARNKTSSRSHTLLTISIKRRRCLGASDLNEDDEDDIDALEPISTVSFVDLAGSERVEGALHYLHATRKRQELRIREAKFINRSLSALGSVIAALSAQDERRGRSSLPTVFARRAAKPGGSPSHKTTPAAPHIRFRDSQLTKLLQSRLMNGQGRLVLIATIDDRPANLMETLSTLKFASQCRRVDLSKSRAAKADAARKQREESLLKQVFAEVKETYETREAELRRQYESRIEALDDRLRSLQHTNESAQKVPRPNAAYVALCSLVDIAQRQLGRPIASHPPLDAFEDEGDLVKYVADLYRQLKVVIAQPEPAIGSGPSSAIQSGEGRRHSGRKSRAAARGEDGVDITPPPPPANAVREPSATSTAEDREAEFQALARFMFSSGLLQRIAVSSDEEGEAPYSQL